MQEDDRKELAEYCESHGIAAACFVENCSEDELAEIKNIVRSRPDLPELVSVGHDLGGK